MCSSICRPTTPTAPTAVLLLLLGLLALLGYCRPTTAPARLLATTRLVHTLKAELVEHLRVLVELGVGRGEELVAREDAAASSE